MILREREKEREKIRMSHKILKKTKSQCLCKCHHREVTNLINENFLEDIKQMLLFKYWLTLNVSIYITFQLIKDSHKKSTCNNFLSM